MDTAQKLFRLKIQPIATYGLQHFWDCLSVESFRSLDRVKTAFLKRALQVSKYSRNRLVYLLSSAQPLSVDLVASGAFPKTAAYNVHYAEIEHKQLEVEISFFSTPAMNSETWKSSSQQMRHVNTRFACHGFHHRICRRTYFHEAGASCECRLCGMCPIGQYHLLDCSARVRSLNNYATDK